MITGEQVREARLRVHESQADFGERFGVDQSTIHRWETGGVPRRGPARVAIKQVLAAIVPTSEPAEAAE